MRTAQQIIRGIEGLHPSQKHSAEQAVQAGINEARAEFHEALCRVQEYTQRDSTTKEMVGGFVKGMCEEYDPKQTALF